MFFMFDLGISTKLAPVLFRVKMKSPGNKLFKTNQNKFLTENT